MKSITIKTARMALLIFLISVSGAYAGEMKTILILPFTIHSEKDMSYLRGGITDMLRTRLTMENKAIPMLPDASPVPLNIPAGSISETLAGTLGKQANADYVVFGSLTVFGESISTDAKFMDASNRKTLVVCNRSGTRTGDLIKHINLFAQRIKDNVFDKPAHQADHTEISPKTVRKDPVDPWRSETETNRKSSATGSESAIPETSPAPGQANVVMDNIWRSEPEKGKIIGIAASDVNGGGDIEITAVRGSRLFIYRLESGSLKEIDSVKQPSHHSIIALDAGDINGNGVSEIFLTKVSESNGRVVSSVIEWNGEKFTSICDMQPWYFRIIKRYDEPAILVGQKKAMNRPFLEGVHRLEWKNGEYVPSERLNLPDWINVFDFTIGDVFNSGNDHVVAYLSGDLLSILDSSGETMWRSEKPYGGANVYVEYPAEASASSGNREEKDRIYIHQRLLLVDIDRDGATELLACRNDDKMNRALSRLRVFDSGGLECISWNDENRPVIEWKTREFEGYISDFDASDIDRDGRMEIVFSVIGKKESFFGSKMSVIGVFEAGTPKNGE